MNIDIHSNLYRIGFLCEVTITTGSTTLNGEGVVLCVRQVLAPEGYNH